MILTEEEARKKACHKVLAPGASVTETPSVRRMGNCIASDCMAWHWMAYHTPEERRWRRESGIHVPEDAAGYCKAR